MKVLILFLFLINPVEKFDRIDLETMEVTLNGYLVAYLKEEDVNGFYSFTIDNSYYTISVRRNQKFGVVVYLLTSDGEIYCKLNECDENIYCI